jgi:uncharacterized protein
MDRLTMRIAWRRLDVVGLELLTLHIGQERVRAESTVLCMEDGGFRLDHAWELTRDWRAVSLRCVRHAAGESVRLLLERDGAGWRVNGASRPDLDGAEEPDLSVTPFCNTLPIRRVPDSPRASLTIDTAYVDGRDLSVTRAPQRYDRLGTNRFRFVSLSDGFEAELQVDELGLVQHYQHLFERLPHAMEGVLGTDQ